MGKETDSRGIIVHHQIVGVLLCFKEDYLSQMENNVKINI